MRTTSSGSFRAIALFALLAVVMAWACGSGQDGGPPDGVGVGGGGDGGDVDGFSFGSFDGSPDLTGTLAITPVDPTVTVTTGQPTPTISFKATLDGRPVPASWQVDHGELGSIDQTSGVFTPRGTLAGKTDVHAHYFTKEARTSVTVKVHIVQNGDSAGDGGAGAGGYGGVGGEGPGGPVDDGTHQILTGPPTPDPSLAWLYPYDKTVWPRGILAPLLQWKTQRPFDAVYIHIQEALWEYEGFFKRPAVPFVHHPIPQSVWKYMTLSNGGEPATVSLVFASGTTAYGPIRETWKVAQGTLKGTVYYNSYGTNLATSGLKSITGADIGAATLAIRGGSTDPVLVTANNECRVCHSVAANGSRLITSGPAAVELANHNQVIPIGSDNRVMWSAIYPDGKLLFSNSAPQQDGNATLPSELHALPSGASVPSTGLPAGLQAGCPSFSPDGARVTYNIWGGPNADQKSLGLMDFDLSTTKFSNASVLYTPPSGTAVWPAFIPTLNTPEFPSNGAVAFELETVNNGQFGETRSGCDAVSSCPASRGELWWVDVKTKIAHRLDNASGVGMVPVEGYGHDDDATLNYEPTVNPVASGGYAWIVFTSRRLYGNIATIDPFYSDPRFHDISRTPTTKKLWVAAIDLNAAPGTDPSHPAFYVPAQELMAGNSRGYWVLDPCVVDGTTCDTGDECCGGYCQQGPNGAVCSSQPKGCSQEFDKCTTAADCCATVDVCVNGRCAQPPPR